MRSTPMQGGFHIAGSGLALAVVMRGEPNSVVCHFASKPSAETVEFSGSTSPEKLGDGQDDRNTADISLAAGVTADWPVPGRLTRPLKLTRTPSLASGSGQFA